MKSNHNWRKTLVQSRYRKVSFWCPSEKPVLNFQSALKSHKSLEWTILNLPYWESTRLVCKFAPTSFGVSSCVYHGSLGMLCGSGVTRNFYVIFATCWSLHGMGIACWMQQILDRGKSLGNLFLVTANS